MSFTTDQLQAIDEAIAQGALSVRYADKQVTYRSLEEMMKIRDIMRKDLGLVDSSARRSYPAFSKGIV